MCLRAAQSLVVLWISATVPSLGRPLDNVTTMTVGPNDLAAVKAALIARNTDSSSPGAKLLSCPTVTSRPAVAAAWTAASIAACRCSCRSGGQATV